MIIEEGLEVGDRGKRPGNDGPKASIAGEVIPCNDFMTIKLNMWMTNLF